MSARERGTDMTVLQIRQARQDAFRKGYESKTGSPMPTGVHFDDDDLIEAQRIAEKHERYYPGCRWELASLTILGEDAAVSAMCADEDAQGTPQ